MLNGALGLGLSHPLLIGDKLCNTQMQISANLAAYSRDEMDVVIEAWLNALKEDPLLNTDQSLPRAKLLDHIPQLLKGFGRSFGTWGPASPQIQVASGRPRRPRVSAVETGIRPERGCARAGLAK